MAVFTTFANRLPDPAYGIAETGENVNATANYGPGFATIKVTSEQPISVSTTNSGRTITRSVAAHRWKIAITYNPMTRDDFEPIYNFLMERRGFNYSNENIFEKPIFEKKKSFFRFRYLREYIEAAYKIKKTKLAPEKIEALNFLDKLIQSDRFQKKFKLNQGDLIILNNNILAHGRTRFNLNSEDGQRTLIRVWVK